MYVILYGILEVSMCKSMTMMLPLSDSLLKARKLLKSHDLVSPTAQPDTFPVSSIETDAFSPHNDPYHPELKA